MLWLDANGNRIYSNETMRRLKKHIDDNNLKLKEEGYNETLDREPISLPDMELRTAEEKRADSEGSLWLL